MVDRDPESTWPLFNLSARDWLRRVAENQRTFIVRVCVRVCVCKNTGNPCHMCVKAGGSLSLQLSFPINLKLLGI